MDKAWLYRPARCRPVRAQEYLGRATTLVFLERAPGEEASSGIASRRLRSESTGKAWLYRPVRCRPVRVQEYSGQVTTLALRGRVGAAGRCIYHWIAKTSASRSGAIGSSRTAASQCRNPSAPPFD